MFFVVTNTAADILAYRMTTFGPLLVSVGVFIVPFTYICSDIITEVYGYNLTRQVIWMGLINEFIFNFICYSMNLFSAPAFLHNQPAYLQVLSPLMRIYFGVILANIASIFINAYCISKWKILLKGRFFWLRSLGASSIGQLTFTILCDIVVFSGTMQFMQVLRTIESIFLIKICCEIILVYPANILVKILKKHEKINVYDNDINYNPFKILNKKNIEEQGVIRS